MDNWIKNMKGDPIPWLLNSNPWTKHKTLTDLLDYPESDPKVLEAKNEILNYPMIIDLAYQANEWMPTAIARNNDPKINYFKLKMLADFGLIYTDLQLTGTLEKATQHIIDNMFAIRGQTPERPKRGEKFQKPDPTANVWHVAPCNSPVITSALIGLKYSSKQLDMAIDELNKRWLIEDSWFCNFFFVESQYKKLHVGCPMAGIVALEVFSQVPELKESVAAKNAFMPLNFHKEFGKTLYYFGRSKKFHTLKYPFVWYNALYMADILSRFEFLKNEPVVCDLINWILECQDQEGKFRPTSVFMNFKGWDFANKKEPSPWITYLCCRILKQYYI